jgi:hypothetical protein
MPTPHGSRGGLAFSADELRVLRCALADALHHAPLTPADRRPEYLRLAHALEEAAHESERARSFLLADLARYRDALPGAARGYLERLAEALDGGYLPSPRDLAALRTLAAAPCGPAESRRRGRLRRRCEELAGPPSRPRPPAQGAARPQRADRRLLALAGGRAAGEAPSAGSVPACGAAADGEPPRPPAGPQPDRRVPTPAELWPPRRRESPREPRRATG